MMLRNLFFSLIVAGAVGARAEQPVQQQQQPQQGQPQQQKAGGAGGDAGAKPKAAAMVIEEDSNEPPPPAPAGEEKAAIGQYIRFNSGDVQDCYAKALEKRPTLAGKLVARFDIGPTGKVIGAGADGIPDRDLVICVISVVRRWEFARPASGGKLRVAYPFKFEPQPYH